VSLNLVRLTTWLSPAFPVGAFSYSHGLEQLIADDAITSPATLRPWLVDLLERGSGWNDAVLFGEAHGAARTGDMRRLRDVAELAEALAAGRERHLETMAQGRAFLAAIAAAWPSPAVTVLRESDGAAYPVAVGAVAADRQIAADAALSVWLNAFMATLVSVAVRLVPIGQSAGLAVLASLHPKILVVAERALASTLDDLGSATVAAEIASMCHETLHTRIFRT
jgi:urease accessory protein